MTTRIVGTTLGGYPMFERHESPKMLQCTAHGRGRSVCVSDWREASATFRRFVEDNDLGASDLDQASGKILQGGRLVAFVTYNGKVWVMVGRGSKQLVFDPSEPDAHAFIQRTEHAPWIAACACGHKFDAKTAERRRALWRDHVGAVEERRQLRDDIKTVLDLAAEHDHQLQRPELVERVREQLNKLLGEDV